MSSNLQFVLPFLVYLGMFKDEQLVCLVMFEDEQTVHLVLAEAN